MWFGQIVHFSGELEFFMIFIYFFSPSSCREWMEWVTFRMHYLDTLQLHFFFCIVKIHVFYFLSSQEIFSCVFNVPISICGMEKLLLPLISGGHS